MGSPGPVSASEPLLSRKADMKLSVSAQGADWMSSSSWEAALSYACRKIQCSPLRALAGIADSCFVSFNDFAPERLAEGMSGQL